MPVEHGRELYAEAPNGYAFVEVPGASHCGFITGLGEAEYTRLITRFAEDDA